MKFARIAALLAVLALPTSAVLVRPVHAQTPNINLIPELPTKTQEEKDAEAARDKAYKESLKKIPDAKTSNDPWGGVRSDAPKDARAPVPSGKSSATAKKTRTGNAN